MKSQYTINNAFIVKYFYMFRRIYIIFRASLLIKAEVTKSIIMFTDFINLECMKREYDDVNTSEHVGVLYDRDIVVNTLCICWSKQLKNQVNQSRYRPVVAHRVPGS